MLDHLSPFARRSVAVALYWMLTGYRFDVCVLRQCLGVAEVAYAQADFEALRLHHCTRYGDMPPGLHAEVAAATLAIVAGRPVLGDGLLKDLAAAAGLDARSAPALQALAPALA